MLIRLKKINILITFAFTGVFLMLVFLLASAEGEQEDKKYIKWAELNVSCEALEDATELDISSYGKLYHISFIDTLSYLAMKNGNNWSSYSKSQLDSML